MAILTALLKGELSGEGGLATLSPRGLAGAGSRAVGAAPPGEAGCPGVPRCEAAAQGRAGWVWGPVCLRVLTACVAGISTGSRG